MEWEQDGELTTPDLSLVLERLARVDRQLTTISQHRATQSVERP